MKLLMSRTSAIKELQEKHDEMVNLAEHAKGDIEELTDIAKDEFCKG